MKLMRSFSLSRLLVGATLLLAIDTAQATPFPAGADTSGADATAVVDAGGAGDYLTLKAAADAFNAIPGGIQKNWTIAIASDLSESANIGIGNATNGFTLTIRPSGAARVVDFTQLTDNTGFSGHLVIGAADLSTTNVISANNVVVDGALTVGGTSRDLTLRNASAVVPNPYIIRVIGNSDNVQIKNAVLTNRSTSGNSGYGVFFTSRNAAATDFIPDNGLVQNCQITGTTGNALQGVASSNSGTITSGTAQTGLIVQDNIITARTRGIFLNQSAGATIRRNTIRVTQLGSGSWSQGIYYLSDNSSTPWTFDVYDNVFDQLTTANTATAAGITGIAIDAGGAAGTKNANIYNNLLSGFSLPNTTAVDARYAGMRFSAINVNYLVEHNSIHMPDFTVTSNATLSHTAAISFPGTMAAGKTITARNNAIIYGDNGGAAIFRATGGSFTSEGNNIFPLAGARVGSVNAVISTTFPDWQTAGFDSTASGGQSVDFFNTSPSAWGANLRWTGTDKPAGVISTASSTILVDIDGDLRTSGLAYPGGDEFAAFPLPVELSIFVAE